jgi:acylphosphatase
VGLPSGIITAMPLRIARCVVVHGRVQGVWFRDSARHEARSRGVAGWVRNRSDGSVQAWLEGAPDAVEALIGWLHEGPPRAQVERVEVSEGEPEGLDGFDVR